MKTVGARDIYVLEKKQDKSRGIRDTKGERSNIFKDVRDPKTQTYTQQISPQNKSEMRGKYKFENLSPEDLSLQNIIGRCY